MENQNQTKQTTKSTNDKTKTLQAKKNPNKTQQEQKRKPHKTPKWNQTNNSTTTKQKNNPGGSVRIFKGSYLLSAAELLAVSQAHLLPLITIKMTNEKRKAGGEADSTEGTMLDEFTCVQTRSNSRENYIADQAGVRE